jgi:hypothetical protein
MVARDGVERFGAQRFQQLADYTKDTKDTEDMKDIPCVRFVCGFSVLRTPFQLTQQRFCFHFSLTEIKSYPVSALMNRPPSASGGIKDL